MEQIKEKLEGTIASLTEKKQLLEKHKTNYNDLKFKLYDFEQYKESDMPEIEVQISSKAKVKANVLNPKKILVFLGCEYFVERDPTTAVEQVENKLRFLNKAIDEFNMRIKDANRTLKDLDSLKSLDSKKLKKHLDQSGDQLDQVNAEDEDLPFMDIREELDDDGNVINSTIQPHDENRLKEFSKEHGIKIVNEEDDDNDELNELLRDMEIIPNAKGDKKIQELKETDIIEEKSEPHSEKKISHKGDDSTVMDIVVERELEEEDNRATLDTIVEREVVYDDDDRAVLDTIVEREVVEDRAVADTIVEREVVENRAVTDTIVEKEVDGEYASTDVAAIETIRDTENIIDEIPKEETKKDLSSEEVHEYYQLFKDFGIINTHVPPIEKDSVNVETTTKEQRDSTPTVDIDELTSKYPASKPALDEEDLLQLQLISDEIDEDSNSDEHEEEEDYYYDEDALKASLGNFDDDEEDNDDGYEDWDEREQDAGIIPSNYTNLFMKELERVRKQSNTVKKEEEVAVEEIAEVVKPKKSVQFSDELQIKEIENISEELKAIETPLKKSRFKQERSSTMSIGGIKYDDKLTSTTVKEREDTVGDVVEKDDVEKVESAIQDIVERDTVEEMTNDSSLVVEEKLKSKVSRFKASKMNNGTIQATQHSVPTVISIPENEPLEPIVEDEYQNIKEYVEMEDDDEDEQLLNQMTDNISVYREDERDIDDIDSDQDIEFEDEDEDDGVMLVDQIVENDEVDDPDYFVDHNILEKEYKDARKSMIAKYLTKEEVEQMSMAKPNIVKNWEQGEEFEPIDESGNPLKVSRFKKSFKK